MSTTNINSILDKKEIEIKYDVNDDLIFNYDAPLDLRLRSLEDFYRKKEDHTLDLIKKLAVLYQMAGVTVLREYLYNICIKTILNPFLKSILAQSLVLYNDNDNLGYKAIISVYEQMDDSIGTPYKVDFLKLLMNRDKYRDSALIYFCDLISDQKIECEYRYRIILGLEEKNTDNPKLSPEQASFYMRKSFQRFCLDEKNKILYRILSSQFLLQNEDCETKDRIEEVLLSFAENKDVEYNLRADASDVLLQLGSESHKIRAREIIMDLGRQGRRARDIYNNAQNVHSTGVEESVGKALEFLNSINIKKIDNVEITFEYVENEIKNLAKEYNSQLDLIEISLNRIYMDRILYSKYNCRLEDILLKIWTYLLNHKNCEDMKKRLLEELEDMSGTCSSGLISRLINTISGFGDFSMRITWKEQIVANFTGRLNARIRDMDNLILQEKVLEEMILETIKYAERKHFLRFLRENMLSIREELYEEFKEFINDNEFDLYIREAISMYETGQFQ